MTRGGAKPRGRVANTPPTANSQSRVGRLKNAAGGFTGVNWTDAANDRIMTTVIAAHNPVRRPGTTASNNGQSR